MIFKYCLNRSIFAFEFVKTSLLLASLTTFLT